ncbi:hypothetical protein FSP39_009844 [Pinctada imbricata]|uniref:Uncharacterized protein n=1 Tax=Pinctada imbricata TaxID=66713 RepID=A0AA88Y338_PINIB|nr:hypothetical protein FSP39_009844 [Pinctada imbricata]
MSEEAEKQSTQSRILSKLESLYFRWEIVSTTYVMDPTEKIIFKLQPALRRISPIGTPLALAADDEAALVLCAENRKMSIPARPKNVFIHLEIVLLHTSLCGFK